MLKKIILLLLLQALSLNFAIAFDEVVIGSVPVDQNKNISFFPQPTSQPLVADIALKGNEILISRDQYFISYNQKCHLLNWVEWKIDGNDLGDVKRTNTFAMDQELDDYLSQHSTHAVTLEDYKGSCFDRGHQVPSADRTNSIEDNRMTFTLSNMLPQTAYLNRVIWRNLETFARNLVKNYDKKVYLIAGPIFDEDFGKMGLHKDIPIPSKNFKILIILNKDQSLSDINSNTEIISVIMPNRLKSGKKPLDDLNELCNKAAADPGTTNMESTPINNDWHQYIAPLSEIERLSGFKFIPNSVARKAKAKI